MAKAKDSKKDEGGDKKAKKKGGIPLVALILGGIAAMLALPITLVLAGALLPTGAIALTDRSEKRSATVCIGALNLASAVVVVMQLIRSGLSFDSALALLMQPMNWLIMWAGAAVGWAILTFVPPTVAQILAGMAEMRMTKLKKNLEDIKKNWSDSVAN